MATIAEQVVQELSPYLGPFNAKIAVRSFAQRVLNLTPEELTEQHLTALLTALEPMLRTMAGGPTTEKLLAQIKLEVH